MFVMFCLYRAVFKMVFLFSGFDSSVKFNVKLLYANKI